MKSTKEWKISDEIMRVMLFIGRSAMDVCFYFKGGGSLAQKIANSVCSAK
jgi:hypothetical protein